MGKAWRRNPAIVFCHAAAEAGLLKFAPSLSAAMVTLRRILKAHSKRNAEETANNATLIFR
jgi:hypothetical protein